MWADRRLPPIARLIILCRYQTCELCMNGEKPKKIKIKDGSNLRQKQLLGHLSPHSMRSSQVQVECLYKPRLTDPAIVMRLS